jgi:hypothetical protein
MLRLFLLSSLVLTADIWQVVRVIQPFVSGTSALRLRITAAEDIHTGSCALFGHLMARNLHPGAKMAISVFGILLLVVRLVELLVTVGRGLIQTKHG